MKKYRIIKTPTPADEVKKSHNSQAHPRLQKKLEDIEKMGEQCLGDSEISGHVGHDSSCVKNVFKDCSDLILREIELGDKKIPCLAVFLDSLINKNLVNDFFLKPLMTDARLKEDNGAFADGKLASGLKASLLYSYQVEELSLFRDAAMKILSGYCVLFIGGSKTAIAADLKKDTGRQVTTSIIEPVVKGPQEAFVEDLKTNISLLRKRLRTPEFKLETLDIGRLSGTPVVISYINGIAEAKTVDEVRKRIRRIDIDIVIDSSYIEKLIEDDPLSPFSQMLSTERPDKVVAALAEGRIAVMIDGSPNILVVPVTLSDFLISAEDYYSKFYFSTLVRILRYAALALALLGPSFYIAVTTFHQEMIPLPLLITIARSRAEVPFPAIVEALAMEFTFELLREAGIRLPQPIGPAVSIVGGLVIGQGVVQAGIVSQTMVIVVAATGMASFSFPAFNKAITVRFLRFPFMILASILGMYGIIMGILVLLIHLTGLRSMGVPYLSPFSPVSFKDLKDSIVVMPLWTFIKRPSFIQKNNPTRMKKGLKPGPEQ